MKPMSQTVVALPVAMLFAFTAAVSAQDAPDAPAEAAPQVVQADVTVVEVSGRAAQFRTGPDAAWQKLTTDSKLGVGSEIRTLPGTARFASLDDWIYTDVKGWTLADRIDDEGYARLRAAAPAKLSRFVQPDGHVAFDAPAHIVTALAAG